MIRRARESDVPAITALVHELAAYEKSSSLCTVRAEQLRSALFGAQPSVFAHVDAGVRAAAGRAHAAARRPRPDLQEAGDVEDVGERAEEGQLEVRRLVVG